MRKIILCMVLASSFVVGKNLSKEKIQEFEKNCETGNMMNCGALGEIYQIGIDGVKQDFAKALKFHTKACSGNNYFSCSNLGIMYKEGKGVEKDYKKAIELYTKACNNKNIGGCINLGNMHYKGQGVEKDMAKGAGYFKMACDLGNFTACYNFAFYSYSNRDIKVATEYCKKACDLGKDEPEAKIPHNKAVWQQACDTYNALNALK